MALAGDLDHRGVRACAPGLAVNRIGAKARLIPARDLGLGPLGVARKGRIRLTLPRSIASGSRWYARCKGCCGVRPSRASPAPIEARLNRTPNRCAISSRTIWRVHKPKSNPYCRGFLLSVQRNTCRSCLAVRVRGRPVAGRAASTWSPCPRPRVTVSQR